MFHGCFFFLSSSLHFTSFVCLELDEYFDSLSATVAAVRDAAQSADVVGVIGSNAFGERLREATAIVGQVRKYCQVFQKHYATVEQRVQTEKANLAAKDRMQWSLISDGYKEIDDIHQSEVDASRRHLDQLQQLLKDLVDKCEKHNLVFPCFVTQKYIFLIVPNSLYPLAAKTQPNLHATQHAMQLMTTLATTSTTIDARLARRDALLVQLAPLLRVRATYAAALAEAQRRNRFEATRAALVRIRVLEIVETSFFFFLTRETH